MGVTSARTRVGAVLLLALAALPVIAQPQPARQAPGLVRVVLRTSEGPIIIALETRRAPVTAANFLKYVDGGRLDGTTFYRAARASTDPHRGLVQGGIDHNIRASFFPIAHEPTSRTGLRHVDGTVSMARNDPGTAMGDFFITAGPAPRLDAAPNYPGYAAFGHVVSGMNVVQRILAKPTYPGGLSAETMGQTIRQPVKILSARRVP